MPEELYYPLLSFLTVAFYFSLVRQVRAQRSSGTRLAARVLFALAIPYVLLAAWAGEVWESLVRLAFSSAALVLAVVGLISPMGATREEKRLPQRATWWVFCGVLAFDFVAFVFRPKLLFAVASREVVVSAWVLLLTFVLAMGTGRNTPNDGA